eukprot:305775-Hanusia_phi.AAC.1
MMSLSHRPYGGSRRPAAGGSGPARSAEPVIQLCGVGVRAVSERPRRRRGTRPPRREAGARLTRRL